mgnify:CR=1 FL=1
MLNRDDCIKTELNKQLNRIKYIKSTLDGNPYCSFPPRRIFIEPTNICNLNCIHCVHDGKMTRKKGMMSLELFKKIMEDVKDWNKCTEIALFQQGDPLIHKDIDKIVKIAATDYDFFVILTTNGVALTKELSEELVRNRLDYMIFSLDAATPETFERIKRRPYFDKVINNILDYLEVWGDLKTDFERNYFAADINLVEEPDNKEEIPFFKEIFKKLPIGHVSINPMHNFTGAIDLPSKFNNEKAKQAPCCNAPWDVVGVRWDGEVVACIYDFDSRYVIGNVKEQSLKEIWNSERMINFRKSIYEQEFKKVEQNGPLCSECSIRFDPNYQLPKDYHSEVARMEKYLSDTVKRVSLRKEKTETLLAKHEYLKKNREQWVKELYSKSISQGD